MGFISSARKDLINAMDTLMAAASRSLRTGNGDTFTIKTLKTMIEVQARWTEADLNRLRILKG